jgi:hypothetical protein
MHTRRRLGPNGKELRPVTAGAGLLVLPRLTMGQQIVLLAGAPGIRKTISAHPPQLPVR